MNPIHYFAFVYFIIELAAKKHSRWPPHPSHKNYLSLCFGGLLFFIRMNNLIQLLKARADYSFVGGTFLYRCCEWGAALSIPIQVVARAAAAAAAAAGAAAARCAAVIVSPKLSGRYSIMFSLR
jgi:hypothetical protein